LVQDIRNHGFQKLEAQKKMKSMKLLFVLTALNF